MRSLVLLLAPLAMAATMGSNKVDRDHEVDGEYKELLIMMHDCRNCHDVKMTIVS